MDQPCADEVDGENLRGWLCHPCNRGLGNFKENQHLIQRAAQYVGSGGWSKDQLEEDWND